MLPFSQVAFYRVVSDVSEYQQFVPYMAKSYILPETVKDGKFEAITQIGFDQLKFEYKSKVSYTEPSRVLSVSSTESKIFEELHSLWQIEHVDDHSCKVDYNIQMTFSNPLFATVT